MITGKDVLWIFEQANPMWPLYLGHPTTGEPVELSKEVYEYVLELLRKENRSANN